MQIDWWTLVLQAINFLILLWLLSRFLYRPARAVIEKRRLLARQALEDAARREQHAEEIRQELEAQRIALEAEHQALRDRVHDEIEVQRREILDAARVEARDLLDHTRAGLAAERRAALAAIRSEVSQLAAALAADLLRKTQSDDDVFLRRLAAELDRLPDPERKRLQSDLAADGTGLTIATAHPLEETERGRWIERLSAGLGRSLRPRFVTDPALVGGAEIRFPHAVLRFTWEEELRKAQALLESDDDAA